MSTVDQQVLSCFRVTGFFDFITKNPPKKNVSRGYAMIARTLMNKEVDMTTKELGDSLKSLDKEGYLTLDKDKSRASLKEKGYQEILKM